MEVLVVVGIMAVLAGLIAPAMNIGKSRRLAMGGNLVANLVQQARQNSIAKNTMTALVSVSNSPEDDWNGQLVILVELSGDPLEWKPITKWERLPTEVILDPSYSAGQASNFFENSPSVTPGIALPPYAGSPVDTEFCGYQVFAPGGRLITTGIINPSSPLLRLVEGSVRDGQIQKQNTKNYYDIVINRFTGIPKIDRP